MKAATPVLKDVVLVGAGHSHVTVLRMFGMKPIPGVRLTLISREVHTPYSGMLPGLIAGHYGFDDAHIDTGPLARFAGARLYQDEAVDVDLAGRYVICRRRPPVPYDLLSLNIGSTPNTADVPGASEHAIPVKPIDGFLPRFEALQARVLARKGRTAVALVGAGAGGVELLLAVEHRLRQAVARAGFDAGGLSFVLVSDVPDILPSFPAAFRARFRAVLAARGIAVITGAPVTRVEAGRLMLAGCGPLAADEILWTTQAAPARWLAKAGLPLDARGFLRVDQTLRVVGRDDVFAAGDTIAFSGRELPKSGVYAVRAGPALAENIRRTLTGLVAAVPAAARGALSDFDWGTSRGGYPQRPRGRGRLGVAVEGLDRSSLHAQVQRAAGDDARAGGGASAIGRPGGAQGNFRHRHALRRLRRQGRRHRALACACKHRACCACRRRRGARRAR